MWVQPEETKINLNVYDSSQFLEESSISLVHFALITQAQKDNAGTLLR